jgi:aspartyl-tRNA(Asn)/glutamyl-tRNA(Gln) amidotransferase subunit A
MSELAFSGLGLNPITATSPCVNDHGAVAGGSSSGAATSVAFDLAPCGVGSDTGGSVRIPAAWNDLVGLKTTSGRLSLKGVVPLAPRFDTVGPLCRNVEDAALMLGALEGCDTPDWQGESLTGKRFLILENGLEDARKQPKAGFESAVGRLMNAGAQVERAHFPMIEEALSLTGVLFATEAYATWYNEIEAQPDLMFLPILKRFQSGGQYSGVEYVRAWQRLVAIREDYHEAIEKYDGVIMPTSPILPPNIERLVNDPAYYVEENLLSLRNTRIGNLMGSCGLTLPTGLPSTGIMLLLPPLKEEQLLRLGAAFEEAMS